MYNTQNKKYLAENEARNKCFSECKSLEITVSNTGGFPEIFTFFDANQAELVTSGEPSHLTFSNVDDYNFLMQQLRQDPLILSGIELVTDDSDQLLNPINVSVEDASGNALLYQHLPNTFIDKQQVTNKRVFIDTRNLMLDGYNILPSYTINAETTITFLLFYKQFKRSDFLNTHSFKIAKKKIFEKGELLDDEIEYYNEVSDESKNTVSKQDIDNKNLKK